MQKTEYDGFVDMLKKLEGNDNCDGGKEGGVELQKIVRCTFSDHVQLGKRLSHRHRSSNLISSLNVVKLCETGTKMYFCIPVQKISRLAKEAGALLSM